MSPIILLGIVSLTTVLSFFLAYEHGKKEKKFSWVEYALLALSAILATVPVALTYGLRILLLFGISIVLGMLMEHVIGFLCHKTLKRHIWRYYRYTLGGYTSLLIAPFWGMAGVFFFLASKVLGL